MNPKPSEHPTVIDALQHAGAAHARQHALLFALRSALWLIALIPLLLVADILFHFSDLLRLGGSIAIAVAAAASLGTAIWRACVVRPPLLRIARLLEERNPQLGSKLVNILQLDEAAQIPNADPLTRTLARHAIDDAGKSLDLPALAPLVKERAVPRRVRQVLGSAAVLAAIILFGGHHARQQWLRFADPFGDHPPFSLTRLEIAKPGANDSVLYGGAFTVEAAAYGHPPKELFVTAVATDGQSPALTLPMFARGDGTFVTTLENIRHPLEFTVHTRDQRSRSRHRRLGLILTPQIEQCVVRITPPAYTGLPERKLPYRFTSLQTLSGSRIAIEITSNRPLGSGSIEMEGVGSAPATLTLGPGSEPNSHTVGTEFIAEHSARLTFFIRDIDGNPASETPSSSLTVSSDLPPTVAIASPEKDALVAENFTLPVVTEGSDDYGLHSLRLHIAVNDHFLAIDPATPESPTARHQRIEYPLDLAKAGAKAGDRIDIFAEAVDNRPDPQIARSPIRHLLVITEAEYNRQLRELADVAMIAGKYEELLGRFEDQLAEQGRIAEALDALHKAAKQNPGDEKLLDRFSDAYAQQQHLNRQLEDMAREMREFGRNDPLYDFEKGLHEKLKAQADAIENSVKENNKDGEKALDSSPPPPAAPTPEAVAAMAEAARKQLDRLAGEEKKADEAIREPLQELAQLHELMKDFNRFGELAAEQKELAQQSKAYQDKKELNALDQLALRELGARQRQLAQDLDQLGKKLRHDADAAEEKLPNAAESARKLAEQIDAADMPGLARKAAQSMLRSEAGQAHAQALKLDQEMERLFNDQAQEGQQDVAGELDRVLQLSRNLNPGDSLRQMMMSRHFRPLPGEGGQAGAGGEMANAMTGEDGLLLGGESLMDGPISDSIAGRGDRGGQGSAGAPTAKVDTPDEAKIDRQSSRRTGTPDSSNLLQQYENIADAYFRRLTTKP